MYYNRWLCLFANDLASSRLGSGISLVTVMWRTSGFVTSTGILSSCLGILPIGDQITRDRYRINRDSYRTDWGTIFPDLLSTRVDVYLPLSSKDYCTRSSERCGAPSRPFSTLASENVTDGCGIVTSTESFGPRSWLTRILLVRSHRVPVTLSAGHAECLSHCDLPVPSIRGSRTL